MRVSGRLAASPGSGQDVEMIADTLHILGEVDSRVGIQSSGVIPDHHSD